MSSKLIGGTLLVVGTTIGGGMLALPIASAGGGFLSSSALLFFCWLAMTIPALLMLEVNLWLPANSNIISMAKKTLGPSGAIVAWIAYLLLLYSLVSAYIAGGTDILHNFFGLMHWSTPLWLDSCVFTLVLGFVVYQGIQSVDYVNRGLMSAKLIAFILLMMLILPHIKQLDLSGGHPHLLLSSVTVMITSFGFASIVPSLRVYFDGNVPQLRKVIIVGSFIPLFCYLLWNFSIMGSVPRTGAHGLEQMFFSKSSTTDLVNALNYFLHNSWVTSFAHLFTSICVATSFLGVSIGLTDFLADGFSIAKRGKGAIAVYGLAFVPPLAIILFYPGAFIAGLSYAGICCVVLLMLLPALMAWRGRYQLKIAKGYEVMGGKWLLTLVIIAALLILSISIRN